MIRKYFALIAMSFVLLVGSAAASEDYDQKAVLITGASSGIGRMTAEHLAGSGYFVYAGARKTADIAALNQIENVQAVRLVVPDNDDAEWPIRTLIWELANLNHDHEFSYSRDELVKWLDEELDDLGDTAD